MFKGAHAEAYHVKEDLLLENLVDSKRKDKAKVLRLQQVFHDIANRNLYVFQNIKSCLNNSGKNYA